VVVLGSSVDKDGVVVCVDEAVVLVVVVVTTFVVVTSETKTTFQRLAQEFAFLQ